MMKLTKYVSRAAVAVAFLGTHVDYPISSANLKRVPKFNGMDTILREFTVGGVAGASSDTYTIQLEDDVKDYIPLVVTAFTEANPSVRITTLAITSHNQATGVTVLTASGAVAAGAKVSILYGRAS